MPFGLQEGWLTMNNVSYVLIIFWTTLMMTVLSSEWAKL